MPLPSDPVKQLVRVLQWRKWIMQNHPNPTDAEKFKRFMGMVENGLSNYVREATMKWEPDMLISLGREMKRARPWDVDRATLAINEASKEGPLNLTLLAKVTHENHLCTLSYRQWQRLAKRNKKKVQQRGQPKKK